MDTSTGIASNLDRDIAAPSQPLVMLGSERALLMPSLTEALLRQKDLLASRRPEGLWSVAAE